MRQTVLMICALAAIGTSASAAESLNPVSGTIARIYISPGYIGLPAGAVQRFRVFGVDARGNEIPVPGPVSWEASSKAGKITSEGIFTAGKQTGIFDWAITASVPGGMTATAIIEVFNPLPEGGYKLDRMWGNKAPGQFNHPRSVAVDGKGCVYVADTNNYRVQKFDSSGKYVASWGTYGSGQGQFKRPVSVAVDRKCNVYVTDSVNRTIQKFNPDGRFLMQIKGTDDPKGPLCRPACVAVDDSGNIYVCDRLYRWNGSGVVKLDPSGRLLTSFTLDPEHKTVDMLDPSGITVDRGRVYVADTGQNRVEIFTTDGKFLRAIPASLPLSVAAAQDGTLYVVNNGGHDVARYDSELQLQHTSTLCCSHEDGGYNHGPTGVAVSAAGFVYVLDQIFNTVHKYDPSGKCIARWGTCDRGQFLYVHGIATDYRGDVYATDAVRGRVHKFDASGDCIASWGSASYAGAPLHGAHGIAVDGRGYIYVVTGGGNSALVFDSSGSEITRWPTTGVESSSWIAVDSAYNAYVTGYRPVGVVKFDCTGRQLCSFGVTNPDEYSYYAGSVAVDAEGAVYFVNAGKLSRFDPSGKALPDVAGIESAASVALDRSGNLFVACASEGAAKIKKLDPSMSAVSEWGSAGGGPGQFDYPRGIAVSPDGSVYIADFGNTRIEKFVPVLPK